MFDPGLEPHQTLVHKYMDQERLDHHAGCQEVSRRPSRSEFQESVKMEAM